MAAGTFPGFFSYNNRDDVGLEFLMRLDSQQTSDKAPLWGYCISQIGYCCDQALMVDRMERGFLALGAAVVSPDWVLATASTLGMSLSPLPVS